MILFKMGCISSKRDTCANVFQVVNIDDYGNHLNSGQLEVTETELVFYQRNKSAVRWPLHTLRRYGFFADHFNFESGRRSPTGPGIYAFQCRRASELVSLLESRLQVRPQNDGEGTRRISHRLSSISSGGPLSPLENISTISESLPMMPISNSRSLTQNLYVHEEIIANANANIAAATQVSDAQDETNNNKITDNGREHTYTNTLLGGVDSLEPVPEDSPTPGHHYMNIVPGTENIVPEYKALPLLPVQYMPWEPEETPHNYANLDSGLDRPKRGVMGPSLSKAGLNYIVLDLDSTTEPPPRSPTSSIPPDSPKKIQQGYATIDFDKTAALSHSVDPTFDDSECSRKTRHNSHISELPRHSSSSD